MRRSVLHLTTILLSVASAATLTIAALSIAAPGDGHALPARHEDAAKETIRRFYAAVNQAIATGDVALFEPVLTPDFMDHETTAGGRVGRQDFLDRLADRRAVFPHLHLAVDALSVDGDLVVAQVRSEEGGRGRIAGVPIDAPGGGWSLVDRFRIKDDRIAERWTAPAHTTIAEPLATGVVQIEDLTPRLLSLERLMLGPGDELRRSTDSDPRLLLIVSGALTVRLDESAQESLHIDVSGEGDPARRRAIAPGEDGTVAVGEQLLVTGDRWHPFTLHNDTSAPVEALSLTLEKPSIRQPTDWANPPAAFPGPTVSIVAGGRFESMPRGNATVQIARAVLAPGAALLPDEQSGPVLVAVQRGHLLVAVDPSLADVSDPPGIRRYRPGEPPLGPGSGIQLSPGAAALTSVGTESAEIFIATIAFAPVR